MDESTKCPGCRQSQFSTCDFSTKADNEINKTQEPEVDFNHFDAGTVSVGVIYCIVFVLSIAGNSTVLYVIARHLHYHTSTNVFITVLSLSDLTSVVICLPLTLARLVQDSISSSTPSVFGSITCTVDSVVGMTSDLLSTAMLSLLAVDRYTTTVRQHRAPFVARRTFATVAVIVSGSAILASVWYALRVTALVGIGTGSQVMASYTVDRRWLSICLLTGATAYQLAYVAVLTGCPAVLMIYCAARLIRVVVRSLTRVRPTTTAANQLLFHDELQTAITVVVMVAVFVTCRLCQFVLLSLAVAINSDSKPHTSLSSARSVDAAATLVVWANGAVNPFVYAARNPNVARFLQIDLGFRRRGYLSDTPVPPPATTTPAATVTSATAPTNSTIGGVGLSAHRSSVDVNDDTDSTVAPSLTSSVTDLQNTLPQDVNRKWFSHRKSVVYGEFKLPGLDEYDDDDTSWPPSVDRLRFDSLVVINGNEQSVTSSSSSSEVWTSKRKRSASIPTLVAFPRKQISDCSNRTSSTVISIPF